MAAKVAGCEGFLIDGFPLDLEEAEKFEKQVVPVTRSVSQSVSCSQPFIAIKVN
mgnify:CR=1 FL=1